MKTIYKPLDLAEFGITYLTAEACGLAMRGLYDLTEAGRAIICNAYAINPAGLKEPWNSSFAAGKHVASIMLAHNELKTVAVFALRTVCHTVMIYDDSVLGLESDEELLPQEGEFDDNGDWVETEPYRIRRAGQPYEYRLRKTMQRVFRGNVATRNTHAMSGRVE